MEKKLIVPSQKIYQLKIQLKDILPPIWRKVQVESDITFEELHQIIQVAMGWECCHLWSFRYGDIAISIPDEDDFEPVADALEIEISKILTKEKDDLLYTYDFGDDWDHKITLEKILKKDSKETYPVCIKGKRACPPENCGGPWGYEDVLDAANNKKHPEHEKMLEWLGDDFDPEKFDLVEVNNCLKNKGC